MSTDGQTQFSQPTQLNITTQQDNTGSQNDHDVW